MSSCNGQTAITRIINQSIYYHHVATFPDAIVTPALKSNNISALTNFHLMSILPVFSKILEYVIHA